MKLQEAFARAVRLGIYRNQRQLANVLFKGHTRGARDCKTSNLMNGHRTLFTEDEIRNICKSLYVDANFLFGIESMSGHLPAWHNIAEELPKEGGVYNITNGEQVKTGMYDADRKSFFFYGNGHPAGVDWGWWMDLNNNSKTKTVG
jgi:hypothetical protein